MAEVISNGNGNSVRTFLKSRMLDQLIDSLQSGRPLLLEDLVDTLAETAFDILGVSDERREEPFFM